MKTQAPEWATYMENVLTGRRLAGELERLCVERCLRLVQKDDVFFDFDEAEDILEIVGYFRHTKGKYAGVLFELMDWQQFFLVMVFAMKNAESGLRLFRKALLCVPKKNGKSEFGGAIAVLMAFFENEEGAECYSAANTYDQAKICWEASMKILKRLRKESESINQDLAIYESTNNRNLVNRSNDSFFKPLAADSKTLDGLNSQFAVIDEYHEAKDSSIPDNLESGSVSREQPLLLITTTRGFNILGPLRQLEDSYIRILRGEAENDAIFPLIFTLDPDDDWENAALWGKANPGLGRTPTPEGLKIAYDKAVTEGSKAEINFKTKNLNIWTSVADRWVKDADFMAGATDWSISEMAGLVCFAGIDLGKTRDFTTVTYLFPPQEKQTKYRTFTRYFLPEESAAEYERKDQVPYLDWGAQGLITLTPGNVIDLDYILATVLNDHATFQIQGISYDPWNATHLATKLAAEGVDMNEMRQNTSSFNEPITFMEKVILSGELDHGNDKVLRWMFGNIQPYYDGNGNIKFDKNKSRQKIDAAVSLAEAFAEYLHHRLEETPEWNIVWN